MTKTPRERVARGLAKLKSKKYYMTRVRSARRNRVSMVLGRVSKPARPKEPVA